MEFTKDGQNNQSRFSGFVKRIRNKNFNPFYEVLGGVFAHSFGIRVTYPGSTALMKLAIGCNFLIESQTSFFVNICYSLS